MKLSRSHLAAGLTRSALVVALSLGLSAMAARAAEKVSVNLDDKEFGQHVDPNTQQASSVDLHAQSGGAVNAAADYYYNIFGTCHGTGDFANFVQPGTTIAELVDMIQPGASKSLVGVKHNQGGNLPYSVLNKTYSGSNSGFTFTLTVKVNITSTGIVKFDVENVSVNGFFKPDGTIKFDDAQADIGVAPIIKMAAKAVTVGEGAGTKDIVVKRSGNLGVASTVHFMTVEDTAKDPADFTAQQGTIKFPVGGNTQKITIKINDNNANTANKRFVVKLTAPVSAAVLGGRKATAVTITDND